MTEKTKPSKDFAKQLTSPTLKALLKKVDPRYITAHSMIDVSHAKA